MVEKILTEAPAVLSEDPAASIDVIASRLGISRATLYRHFSSRTELTTAIHRRALEDALAAINAAKTEHGTASSALRRVIDRVIEVGDRYRFLSGRRAEAEDLRKLEELVGDPLVSLLERGQREGEVRTDRTARVLADQLSGLFTAAIGHVESGELTITEASEATFETFMHGAGAD